MDSLRRVCAVVAVAAVALLACLAPSNVNAYGATGHQVVGAIADQLLTKEAREQVKALIGTTLQTAGPWADCARSVQVSPHDQPDSQAQFAHYVPSVEYSGPCLFFESQEGRGRMEAYVRDNWTVCGPNNGRAGCSRLYHFDDVAIERDTYDPSDVGTGKSDVVSTINAAIAVLQEKPVPSNFAICDKAEAVLMLAHFVGDIHQPLHVGAVYLKDNQEFDPDKNGGAPTETLTAGGNAIYDPEGHTDLHAEWDAVDPPLNPSHLQATMLAEAKALAPTTGAIDTWSAAWATETLQGAKQAYANLHYVPKDSTKTPWEVHFTPDTPDGRAQYMQQKNDLQSHELAKAGARLAQILNATLSTPPAETQKGYLSLAELHASTQWIPQRPADDSPVVAADALTFLNTRSYVGTDRWQTAEDDDEYTDFDKLNARFQKATGKILTTATTPILSGILKQMEADEGGLLAPMKKDVCAGGRRRPIYEYPYPPKYFCPVKLSPAPYRPLVETGSYPSGHATLGEMWSGVLAELIPDRANEILARGVDFGQSRVVCGFHYQSDVDAGRVAGAGLLAQLHGNPKFVDDLKRAAAEVKNAPKADAKTDSSKNPRAPRRVDERPDA